MIQQILIWSLAGLMLSSLHTGGEESPLPAMPHLVDTSAMEQGSYHAESISTANHNPMYIGKYRDTILITHHWTDLEAYYVFGRDKEKLQRPDSNGLQLFVHTGPVISNRLARPLGSRNNVQSFRAYPVMLLNTSPNAWNIGSGFHIPLILEAMDRKGNWRAIEEPYFYKCGTGMNCIMLPANEIAITSVPIQQGAFETRLRLRFRHIISNEFAGSIEPSQFESRFQQK